MKRKYYIKDLIEVLDCKLVALFVSKDLFVFTSEKEQIYVQDPQEAVNIKSLLASKKIVKIFLKDHFEVFRNFFKCKIRNIFILEIMSRIVRTYANNHSFESMVFEFFKCSLKTFSHNFDKISNNSNYILKIYKALKEIAVQEKRFCIVLRVMKACEDFGSCMIV